MKKQLLLYSLFLCPLSSLSSGGMSSAARNRLIKDHIIQALAEKHPATWSEAAEGLKFLQARASRVADLEAQAINHTQTLAAKDTEFAQVLESRNAEHAGVLSQALESRNAEHAKALEELRLNHRASLDKLQQSCTELVERLNGIEGQLKADELNRLQTLLKLQKDNVLSSIKFGSVEPETGSVSDLFRQLAHGIVEANTAVNAANGVSQSLAEEVVLVQDNQKRNKFCAAAFVAGVALNLFRQ